MNPSLVGKLEAMAVRHAELTALLSDLMHPAVETLKRAAECGQIGLLLAVRSRLRAGRKPQGEK